MEIVGDLRTAVSGCAVALQASKGVFVGASERRTAYAAICRLLLELEAHTLELRRTITAISTITTEIQRLLPHSNAVSGLEPSEWRSFFEHHVVGFSARIEHVADMAHNGDACDPGAAVRLCLAFCEAADLQLRRANAAQD